MAQITAFLRGLGAAGATANARDELDRAHAATVTAEVVVRRVKRSESHQFPHHRAA